MNYKIDDKFLQYFKGLKQVFLYLTDKCNLNCGYCLYKPNLTFSLKEEEIPLKTAINLISDFRDLGASKLTIMGGEPTLYDVNNDWESLLRLIDASKDMGYEYVRIDTNGMFDSSLLHKKRFKKLDEITFSLDSPSPKINDCMRGEGVFDKCVRNMKLAIREKYDVHVTCCPTKLSLTGQKEKHRLIHKFILFAESLGVKKVNFHPIFKMGVPRDSWVGRVHIKPEEWLEVYKNIQKNIQKNIYDIPVRIPQRFITRKEFSKNQEYYNYCPVKLGERVLVHPNGLIRICALMISTPYCVGYYYEDRIIWNETLTNEIRNHELEEATQCTNQKGFTEFVPLCISFKPQQEEFVWKSKLNWEYKKRE